MSRQGSITFIANGNSPHTRRWIKPLIGSLKPIHLLSYTFTQNPINEIKTYNLPDYSKTKVIKYLIWGIWVRRYIEQVRPQLLHAIQINGAGWLGWLSNHHPFIITALGSDLLHINQQSAVKAHYSKLALEKCDHLIIPSQYMHQKTIQLGIPTEKSTIIPWGIDHQVFVRAPLAREQLRNRFGLPENSIIILSPRAITETYNIDIIISACSRLIVRMNSIHLMLIKFNVNERYFSYLQQLAIDQNMDKHVLWLDPIRSDQSMAELYTAADIMMSIPSTEGFGVTVFEAMSCGCPSMISDLETFNQLRHGIDCIKVPVRDENSTSAALIDFFTDPSLRKRISDNASLSTRELDISNQVDRAISLYRSIIL